MAIVDPRETIHAALFTALQTVSTTSAPVSAERNPVADLPADAARPALRLYDGDEVTASTTPRPAKRKAPVPCRMQPKIIGFVRDADSGAEISALIALVRAAIWGNDTFLAALGENEVHQDSLVVGFNPAEAVGGEAAFELTLAIDYSFKP